LPTNAQPALGAASDHEKAGLSVSLAETLYAVPAPLLLTVIVNPIWSPALTVPLSAVLAMSIAAHRTVIEPLSLLLASTFDGSLVAEALPVLLIGPQLTAEVTALTV
jgi:hypothetical protein